jgi:hypothetical protein
MPKFKETRNISPMCQGCHLYSFAILKGIDNHDCEQCKTLAEKAFNDGKYHNSIKEIKLTERERKAIEDLGLFLNTIWTNFLHGLLEDQIGSMMQAQ